MPDYCQTFSSFLVGWEPVLFKVWESIQCLWHWIGGSENRWGPTKVIQWCGEWALLSFLWDAIPIWLEKEANCLLKMQDKKDIKYNWKKSQDKYIHIFLLVKIKTMYNPGLWAGAVSGYQEGRCEGGGNAALIEWVRRWCPCFCCLEETIVGMV